MGEGGKPPADAYRTSPVDAYRKSSVDAYSMARASLRFVEYGQEISAAHDWWVRLKSGTGAPPVFLPPYTQHLTPSSVPKQLPIARRSETP